MNIHLSIVIPIHVIPVGNGGSALVRWSQDIPEGCELILALDIDQDDTSLVDWCETYINSPKTIVRRMNGNPGETRNMGLQLAIGEWVTFVDSDDFFHPKKAFKAIEDCGEKSDLIVCRYQTLDFRKSLIRESKRVSNLNELSIDLGFWRCIYRRTFATATSFPSIRMAEDQVYFSRFLTLNPRINFSEEGIYGYVIGGSHQLTATINPKKDLEQAISILHREIEESKTHLDFRKLILLRQYTFLLKSASLASKMKNSLRLLRLVIKPSYFSRLVSLIILIVRFRIRNDRVGKN